MDRATLLRLRQAIDDLDRLSATLPQEREDFISIAHIVQHLRFLQDTVNAGDARETVFVCSEQIASLGQTRDAFARVGRLGLYDRTLGIVTALQKEAHLLAAVQPQHQSPSKMIHR